MISKVALLTTLLVAFDIAAAMKLHARVPHKRLDRDMSRAITEADGLFKRQKTCKGGQTLCEDTEAFCAHVCCYENGEFAGGCPEYTYCDGVGVNAGCCPIGEVCSGPPPPCADATATDISLPTLICATTLPICTTLRNGGYACSGAYSDYVSMTAALETGTMVTPAAEETTTTSSPSKISSTFAVEEPEETTTPALSTSSSNIADDDVPAATSVPTTRAPESSPTNAPLSSASTLAPSLTLVGAILALFLL